MTRMQVSKRTNGEWLPIGFLCFDGGKFFAESDNKDEKKKLERKIAGAKENVDVLSFINNMAVNKKDFKKKPEDEPVDFFRGIRWKYTPYLYRYGLVQTGVKDFFGDEETVE